MAGGLARGKALAAGDNAGNLPPNVPEWMRTPGDQMASQPYWEFVFEQVGVNSRLAAATPAKPPRRLDMTCTAAVRLNEPAVTLVELLPSLDSCGETL